MKLIKPSVELMLQEVPERKLDMSESQHHLAIKDALYSHIEKCGRVCYQSSDRITEDSAKKFIDMIIKRGHTSVLEHGTIYLKWSYTSPTDPECDYADAVDRELFYSRNYYSKYTSECINGYRTDVYVTTNYRVLVQNNRLEDLEFICCPTEHHAKRITAKFILSRNIANEFVRHRVFSFSQESTRYCNYTKDKFGNKITYIIPCWLNIPEGDITTKPEIKGEEYLIRTFIDTDGLPTSKYGHKPNIQEAGYYSNDEYITGDWSDDRWLFIRALEKNEDDYMTFINKGWKPQQAANILPNALKTELVMTGFIDDWKHFFELRCSPAAHPQARELACTLRDEFINREYLS